VCFCGKNGVTDHTDVIVKGENANGTPCRSGRGLSGNSVASGCPNEEDLFNLTRGGESRGWSQPRPSMVFQRTPVYALVGRRLPIRDRTMCFIAVYTYAVSTPTPAVTAPIYKQCCDNYIEAERFLGTSLPPLLRSMQKRAQC